MPDLQIVLILLGFIIVFGVVFYNWRQEKQLRDTIHNGFVVPQKDVLTEGVDPGVLSDQVLDVEPHITGAPIADKVHSVETVDIAAPETHEVAVAPSPNLEPSVPIDETPALVMQEAVLTVEAPPLLLPKAVNAQIDLTAVLTAPSPINGHALYGMTDKILKELKASLMLHGLDKIGVWQPINDLSNQSDTFESVTCSLQLASRHGPVAKPLIHKFEYAMKAIGLEFGATVAWPGEGGVAQRAAELDQFCIEVDKVVSVHVLQGDTPMHGTKLKGMAEANGLKLIRGKFCCVDSENPDLVKYVLAREDEQPFSPEWLRQNVVKAIVFQIELPKVANVDLVFNQMIVVARNMANGLGAKMVDDNRKPLGNVQIDKIKQQLKVLNSQMTVRGIAAGSASSIRLFS
ncbi:MAG: cell division protein ZipA C-terminal FtsZ-binding domain-containing protein [Methylophilaceae bacterium]